jgi:hypothetical protein
MRLLITVLAALALATAAFAAPDDTPFAPVPPDGFQVAYAANLTIADSFINATNAGTVGGFDAADLFGRPFGGICVNAYYFDPNEELLSCCSCYISPNGLHSFSLQKDFLGNLLTPGTENAGTVLLIASSANNASTNQCQGVAAAAGLCGNNPPPGRPNCIEGGLRAWMTTTHNNTSVGPSSYQVTENAFLPAVLSISEVSKVAGLCGTIITNGSKHGLCNSCPSLGLSAGKQ